MAKGKRGKGKSKNKRTKGKRSAKKRKKSNQIPLDVLEKRLGRLNNIVKKRGGDAY